MIFLTLGTQLPFNRLVKAVDVVAPFIKETIYGQIGRGSYTPVNFNFTETLSPTEFDTRFEAARVVIGHAGIGTVLAGFKSQKPLIIMARRASFGEHRNDHQIATAIQMSGFTGVYIAESAEDIRNILTKDHLESMKRQVSPNRNKLIEHLRSEIFE
ncbi:MAG: glucuronosyltransferase [Hymenobacter sp.]|nr:MAG: glucuronosyltransferase [Hymenobacter sp.]